MLDNLWEIITTDNARNLKEPAWKFVRIYERDDSITITAKIVVNIIIAPLFLVFWVAVIIAIAVLLIGYGVKYFLGFKE